MQEKFVVTLTIGVNTVLKAEFSTLVDCIRAAANHYRKTNPNVRFGLQREEFDGEVSNHMYRVTLNNILQEQDVVMIHPLYEYLTPQQIAENLFEFCETLKHNDYLSVKPSDIELVHNAARKIKEMEQMIIDLTSGLETE